MVDENNVDLRFLGHQIQILQRDVRELKAAHIRLDGDVASLRSQVAHVQVELSEVKVDLAGVKEDLAGVKVDLAGVKDDLQGLRTHVTNFERYVDSRFDQMAQTMATNTQILLAAIRKD